MVALKPRYQAFKVTEEFFCCWDLKDDKPVEIGFAASYITSTAHYAHRQVYEKNGRGLAVEWTDISPVLDVLPLSKVISLVSYMAALVDTRLFAIPRLLDKVKDMLYDYEADLEARRTVNEIYGTALDPSFKD